jgi:O-acetylserine/cysteine efflux transporter
VSASRLTPRDAVFIACICVGWAGNFLTSAHALQEVPALLFTTLRMGLLALVLWPFLHRPATGQWPRLITISVGIGAVHFGLNFAAIRAAGDISSPAILMQSYVPMSALLAWAFLGERFAWKTGAAIAVSFAGVLVLGFDPLVLDRPLAMGLMLASAFVLALGGVLLRGLHGQTLWSQQGWMAVLSLPVLLPGTVLLEGNPLTHLTQATWITWVAAMYAAAVASILGHGLFYLLLQRHPVAQITPWLLVTPLLAVGLGVFAWGDRPGPRLWIGGAMVLGGVLAIALRNWQKARAAVASP